MNRSLALSALALVLTIFAACGSDEETPPASPAGPGGSAGSGGSGAAGMGGFKAVAGCDPATATDMSGMAVTVTTTAMLAYEPACIIVAKGDTVTFPNTTTHPIGGMVAAASGSDAGNPIPASTDTAMATVDVTFDTAGSFGFYCRVHGADGAPGTTKMSGAVYVKE
jgi:plastocyanin